MLRRWRWRSKSSLIAFLAVLLITSLVNNSILHAPSSFLASDLDHRIDSAPPFPSYTQYNVSKRGCLDSGPGTHSLFLPETPDGSLAERLRRDLSQSSYKEIFSSCSATCQVQLIPKCPYWELQTFDEHGAPKTVGGDEFYVTYTDSSIFRFDHDDPPFESTRSLVNESSSKFKPNPGNFTAAAWIMDLQNGRYRLDFQCGPFSSCLLGKTTGILTVYFQYTCGIGRMGPPTKGQWSAGGNSVAQYSTTTFIRGPPLRSFEPPIATNSTNRNRLNLNDFESVLPVGDSLLRQLLKPLPGIRFTNIGKPLKTSTVQQWKDHLTHYYGKTGQLQSDRTALLLGSAVWDVLTPDQVSGGEIKTWDDHGQAWHELISYIRTTYPKVTIMWKSPTALHVHVPMIQIHQGAVNELERHFGKRNFYQRLLYMSASRSWELYQLQKKWCQEENIQWLDVYAATYLAADETEIGDGRHFSSRLNTRMVHWFVNESHVETLWRHRRRMTMSSSSSSLSSNRWLRVVGPLQHQQLCPTWVDVLNSVVVALVTGRRIIWNHHPEDAKCSVRLRPDALPLLGMISSPPDDLKSSADVVQLKPSPEQQLLTIQELERKGFLPTVPSQRLASELFSQGEGYLYGMILRTALLPPWPEPYHSSSHDQSGATTRRPLSQTLVVVLLNGNKILEKERLNHCLHHILQLVPQDQQRDASSCHVLASSHQTKLPGNCTVSAHIFPGSGPLLLSDPISFLEHTASIVDAVALPCESSLARLSFHLMEYLRESQARQNGKLPLQDLPHCCL